MFSKQTLKEVLVGNQQEVARQHVMPRPLPDASFPCRVLVGVRRAGKSFMLYQRMQELLAKGEGWESMLYLNFEDDRLEGMASDDFQLILDCHAEMYGQQPPRLFLDEVQNVAGWEKFARRLADTKHEVWITGSNARMLSSEFMTTLGGRYLATEVYPYDWREYLGALQVPYDAHALLGAESRARVLHQWREYLLWGGLPETVGLPVKRDCLSSVLQKIYLTDIASRNKIANPALLRLMLKKLAECVGQSVSYSRLAHVLSSVNGLISSPTVCSYIKHSEAAWLLLRLRNVAAPFAERQTACKYYFIDNGVLNLFLLRGETALLENLVALALFRRYGHDKDNERVFFYNEKAEVDFYVPEDELAIQACYSISQTDATYEREVGALRRLPAVLPCRRRLILTCDEQDTLADEHGLIEVIPLWRWLLEEGA